MEAQIVYLHIYNFIEDFIRIIAYFSQLLVFISGAVVMGESFPLPWSSFCWSNKSKDIRQINRRKSSFIICAQGIHISMKIPKRVRQIGEMSFWTKVKGGEGCLGV